MTTRINLAGQPAKAVLALVNAGAVSRADALAHAKANLARYADKGASATKMRRWERVIATLSDAPAQATYTQAPDPRKAKPAAPKAPALDAGNARVNELLAKRILSNAERSELARLFRGA